MGTTAGVWDWLDVNTTNVWWSPQFYTLLGYHAAELIPSFDSFNTLLHPLDHERTYKMLNEHLTKGTPYNIEYRLKVKSGQYRWFLACGQAKFDDNGKAQRMVGSIVDIDEQKKAAQIMQEYAALMQLIPDGIIYGDKNFCITSLNKGAETLFDLTAPVVIGKQLSEFLLLNISEAERIELRKQLLHTGYLRREIDFTTRSGKKRVALATVKLLNNINEEGPAWVAIYTDLSAQKAADALRQHAEILEAKNKELEQFSYIASHDLQEPLRSISNSVSLLKAEYKDALTGDAKTCIDFIDASATRMSHLVKDLLQYAHVGEEEVLSAMDCNELLTNVLADLQAIINQKQAVINIQPLPVINGYKIALSRLFLNLLANALKFSKAYVVPEINVSCQITTTGFLFAIQDNGIGIAPDFMSKIFLVFQRAHSQSKYEGSGIGLANCKKIAELHGGAIWAESTPGQGTTFFVNLPKL